MVKKFSNVHIFSSNNVNVYTIFSHVLDSDSEILKMINFFSKISPVVKKNKTIFKGLFLQNFLPGGPPMDPLLLLGY